MDSLSPGPVRKPFTERHWRNLLTDHAAAGDLKLLVTRAADSLLENALNQVCFDGQRHTRARTNAEIQILAVSVDFE